MEKKNPTSVAMRSGIFEKDRIPVTENVSSRFRSYLVVPFALAGLTNDTEAVRKPTH